VLKARGVTPEVVMPVVGSVQAIIEDSLPSWAITPHVLTSDDDKWSAFRLATVALAASGTVTLELATAGAPMVIAYKVEPLMAPLLRRMIKVDMAGLPNLIMGRKIFPELIQEACTPEALADAVTETMRDTPLRREQLAALGEIPRRLAVPHGSPSLAAAKIVLAAAAGRR
jgi:lipid-A-disaccharide synthase